ncbi:hypothetical protein CTE05_17220 [Cellulomonas terrae]|uniref:Uncharacterized protein n=1 Tax=Cellulomonas terrae TaxID=311234 RepID=A0A511JJU3_9CELL|nr:hypothetical protein CTE05_17220 [Cellulomonas terrae]
MRSRPGERRTNQLGVGMAVAGGDPQALGARRRSDDRGRAAAAGDGDAASASTFTVPAGDPDWHDVVVAL